MALVANILCHNDYIYLQNLIPVVRRFCDRVLVIDDCSDDYTLPFLSQQKVDVITRKFDFNFANQRNAGLEECNNGDWIFRIDSDEVPTDNIVRDLKGIIRYFDTHNVTRACMPIYHMVNLGMCKTWTGEEIRLYKKNETCMYKGKTHEEITANFGETFQAAFPPHYGLVHFKYCDKNKIAFTEKEFIDNGIYERSDWERRKNMDSTFLPANIHYTINEELECYLNMNNT